LPIRNKNNETSRHYLKTVV